MKISDNNFPKLFLTEVSAPTAPASGVIVVYAKTTGGLFYKDDANTEYQLTQGSLNWSTGISGKPTTLGGYGITDAVGTSSGIYTPTLTGVLNVSASTPSACQYMRVGDTVTVSGRMDINSTAIGNTTVGVSLPIASALAASGQVAGTAVTNHATKAPGIVVADAANDRAQVEYSAPATGSTAIFFTFTYRVI